MAIELYLIRHGIATDLSDENPDDGKRPLTHRGIVRLRKEADALNTLGIAFDQIVTSPLARAKQTADVLAEHLSGRPPVATSDALAPAGTVAAALLDLARHSRRSRIAVIGHEPNIGELATRLLGARAAIEFKKGAICRIDVESLAPVKGARLCWFVTPRMLRRMAK
jgi:phosphohistidine phosphatase